MSSCKCLETEWNSKSLWSNKNETKYTISSFLLFHARNIYVLGTIGFRGFFRKRVEFWLEVGRVLNTSTRRRLSLLSLTLVQIDNRLQWLVWQLRWLQSALPNRNHLSTIRSARTGSWLSASETASFYCCFLGCSRFDAASWEWFSATSSKSPRLLLQCSCKSYSIVWGLSYASFVELLMTTDSGFVLESFSLVGCTLIS
jgi:hypothetical protein